MGRPIFESNTPIDQKRISRIESVVVRLIRKTLGRSSGLITPYPISNAMIGDNIRGSILRYMFPCEGVINKGLIKLGKRSQNGIVSIVKISNDLSVGSKQFIINNKQLLIEPEIEVHTGDCLDISIKPLMEDEKVTEVWISFLWTPNVKDITVKSFLLSELEESMDKAVKELE